MNQNTPKNDEIQNQNDEPAPSIMLKQEEQNQQQINNQYEKPKIQQNQSSLNTQTQQQPTLNSQNQQQPINSQIQQQQPLNSQIQQQPLNSQYYQQPPLNTQFQQQPPLNTQYQQQPMNSQFYQQPQLNTQYYQQPMNSQYQQQPPLNSQYYQQQPINNQYYQQQQPLNTQYQQQPINSQIQQQPINNQYQNFKNIPQPIIIQPTIINEYKHLSSIPSQYENTTINQYKHSSSMPLQNDVKIGEILKEEYNNHKIPHIHPINSQNFTSRYRCDICRKSGDNSICYSCRKCDLDICKKCCSKIFNAPETNRHIHQLYLTKRINWICDICKERNKNISMYCSSCDFDCCINCYFNGIPKKDDDDDGDCSIF